MPQVVLRHLAVPAVSLGLLLGAARPTHAALILTMEEVAGDVVVEGSGTANLAGFTTMAFVASTNSIILPAFAFIAIGANPGVLLDTDVYGVVSGPMSFGVLALTVPSSGTGDRFGVSGQDGRLHVADGYISGAPLSGTSVYASATFASLGVTPGTYVWTWGSGPTADSLTLQIGPAAVPEPVSLSLLGVGVAGFAVRRWRRRTA